MSGKGVKSKRGGHGVITAGDVVIWAVEETVRLRQDFRYCLIFWLILKCKNVIKMNPNLRVFIQEIIFVKLREAYVKDGAYVINLDEYRLIGTHWIALDVNGDNKIYRTQANNIWIIFLLILLVLR